MKGIGIKGAGLRPLGQGGGQAAAPLVFTDDFARADGAVGNGWTGATWTIAAGLVLNTPVLSAEKLNDGGMEAWTNPTNLTNWTENLSGTSTINQENADVQAGLSACRMDIDAGGNAARVIQTLGIANNKWIALEIYSKVSASGPKIYGQINGAGSFTGFTPTTSYAKYKVHHFSPAANKDLWWMPWTGAASKSIFWDTGSCMEFTHSQLGLTRPEYPTSDYILEVTLNAIERGTKLGIMFSLDDPANPQNYAVAQVDGGAVSLWEFAAGARAIKISDGNPKSTNLVNAGDKLKVVKSGASVRVYYNDVAVGALQTLNAAIVNGKYAGVFSTDPANTVSRWSETVRAAGGSTSFLAPFL